MSRARRPAGGRSSERGSGRSPAPTRRRGTSATHDVEDAPSRADELTDDSPSLDVDDANDEVVANDGEKAVVALEEDRGDGRLEREGRQEPHRLEVEELQDLEERQHV